MNFLLIPAILQPTLSRLAYFSAVIILIGYASGIVGDVEWAKITKLSEQERLDQYGIEPVTVNIDPLFVNWSGMLSYITIYSSLWENSACIIQLYSES